MRFLLGLIIGATATVMLAPRLAELGLELPRPAAPGSTPVDTVLQAVAQAIPASAEPVDRAVDEAVQRDTLPLPALPDTPPQTGTPNEPATPAPPPVPTLTEISQEQTVWVPFRSEASARGFAAKLTEQLDRPFGVLRAGPGQYLVVFGYHSEPERAAVLDQIRTLTGYAQL